MKIIIDEEVVEKAGMSMSEMMALLFIKTNPNPQFSIDRLYEKGWLSKDKDKDFYRLGIERKEIVEKAILDSTIGDENKVKELQNTAREMREIFPDGRRGERGSWWRGNQREIEQRLKKFFLKFGEYDKDTILEATKRYVDYFDGDYEKMCLLKNFILKYVEVIDEDGVASIEEKSDLADMIENEDVIIIDKEEIYLR